MPSHKVQLAGGFVILLLSLTGCKFSRTVVNTGVRDLDVTGLEVGESTWREVLEKLGPPDVPIRDVRTFKYQFADSRESGFLARYFIWLPFGWAESTVAEEILVEFDDRGILERITREKRDVVRPPLEGEDSRTPNLTVIIGEPES